MSDADFDQNRRSLIVAGMAGVVLAAAPSLGYSDLAQFTAPPPPHT